MTYSRSSEASSRSATEVASSTLDQALVEHLDTLDAVSLLRWAAQRFPQRAAIVTSFQYSGCVLIDMVHRAGLSLRVATVDTLRLPAETYELIEKIERRYDLEVERYEPDAARVKQMVERHGEYLFFDTKAKQEYCCKVRKTEPNQRCLETLDVWITGLRRDQSQLREQTPKASLVETSNADKTVRRKLVKLAPVADLTEQDLQDYIAQHDVPYNALYEQGYKSIGCVICSTPVLPWEDSRAGRWRWFNRDADHAKECGIHNHGSGI
jgi:phosphoadenosine phosphosulfate reductase